MQLTDIFRGTLPFVFMVFLSMVMMYLFPEIVFYLPDQIYGTN